jgi:transcription initiation factor IIE alpha subunit
MCAICRRYICPSACPSFTGESAELGERLFDCSSCGAVVYENDEYAISYGKPYCKRCVELGKTDDGQGGERGGERNGR